MPFVTETYNVLTGNITVAPCGRVEFDFPDASRAGYL